VWFTGSEFSVKQVSKFPCYSVIRVSQTCRK
jgi:hypothetical protein